MYPGVTRVKTRVLLVEDIDHQLGALRKDIQLIPEDQRHTYGIDDFDIEEASCANEALQKLAKAKTDDRPYDVLVLDLGLPLNKGDIERPQNGYKVLEMVKQSGAAKGVIVLSVFSHYSYVVDAFHGGAIDFIEKEFPLRDKIQERVLRNLASVFAGESNHILEERIKDLIPYAEKGLAHRFTATFSTLINSITHAASEIEKYARERYGLDNERDAQDALIRQLREHRESVSKARQEWANLQAQLATGDEIPQVEVIEDLLSGINADLLPCLTVKKTNLHFDLSQSGKSPVLTFQQDVRAVLKEIIIGGLSELPNYHGSQIIKVMVETNNTRAVVRFEDELKPILKADADAINEGYSIVPDPKFGRAWGLSVAQHIALHGGGELIVEPKDHGNIITYRIPLANHA
jgi:CheY-like chemotaxis protein